MKFDFTDLNVCVDYIKDKQNTQRKEPQEVTSFLKLYTPIYVV